MILGIDPGKTGAICYLGDTMEVVRMPGDAHALSDALGGLPLATHAVVEKVSAGGVSNAQGRSMGASSAFTFGMGFGTIQGVLAALEIPYELVTPQKWTAAMGEKGKDKASHWAHAKRLHPSAKVHKYAADAVLIAEYGRRFLFSN